jgi:hypothetical protein
MMKKGEQTVTISISEYDRLRDESAAIRKIESCGTVLVIEKCTISNKIAIKSGNDEVVKFLSAELKEARYNLAIEEINHTKQRVKCSEYRTELISLKDKLYFWQK